MTHAQYTPLKYTIYYPFPKYTFSLTTVSCTPYVPLRVMNGLRYQPGCCALFCLLFGAQRGHRRPTTDMFWLSFAVMEENDEIVVATLGKNKAQDTTTIIYLVHCIFRFTFFIRMQQSLTVIILLEAVAYPIGACCL